MHTTAKSLPQGAGVRTIMQTCGTLAQGGRTRIKVLFVKSVLLSSVLVFAVSESLADPQDKTNTPVPAAAIKTCHMTPGIMPGGCDWPGKPPRGLYPFHGDGKAESAQAIASSPATNSPPHKLSDLRFSVLDGYRTQADVGKDDKSGAPELDPDKTGLLLLLVTPSSGANKSSNVVEQSGRTK